MRVGLTSRHVERAIAVLTDPPRQIGLREAARAAGKPSGQASGQAQQLSMPFQKKPMGRTGQHVGRMAKPTKLQSERAGRVGQGVRDAQARRAMGQGGRVGRPVKEASEGGAISAAGAGRASRKIVRSVSSSSHSSSSTTTKGQRRVAGATRYA